jgi:6-pyruvoyltetrahydropterin/6-carboxytetrahydropterin synthase
MDHCYLLCSQDSEEFKSFIKSTCDRWIELPFNPSAEMLSMYVFSGVQKILNNTYKNNGEDYIQTHAVRYHETTTGYAECNAIDVIRYQNIINFDNIIYSEGVMKDWGSDLKSIFEGDVVTNPIIKQQIKLNTIL